MLKSNFKYLIQNLQGNRGFSLLELMVVMVIVGILALGVVFMFADPTAKIKAVAFEMRGDIHLARSHAVTDNQDVLIDFGTAAEGYNICVDDWDATSSPAGPGSDDACTGNDTLIKEVAFRENVEYYEFAVLPTNGPDKDPLKSSLSLTPGNGITLGGTSPGVTTLTLFPDGTCNNAGSIVVYYAPPDDPNVIKGDPYAVVIENTVTSRIIIQRWRRDKLAWFRK